MAAPAAAPIRISGQTPLPISIARLRLRISSPLITITVRAACQLKRNRRVKQIRQQGISIKEGMEINTSFLPHSVWHLCSAHVQAPTPRSNSNSNFRLSGGHSPSETVEQFYTCINDNNLEQLGMLLSDDCIYNDLSFPQPFKGKKDVVRFFEQLISVMGKNVKFRIGHVCEGDDGLTAATDWHLEWQGKQIPFTSGCSFYECAEEEGKSLVIKDAKTVIESLMKPGLFVLILLKIVTTLFDDFPKTTESFLKRPDAIPKILLKIYNTILRPFITPLLASYINIWKLLARLLGFAFSIIRYILKIFIK